MLQNLVVGAVMEVGAAVIRVATVEAYRGNMGPRAVKA